MDYSGCREFRGRDKSGGSFRKSLDARFYDRIIDFALRNQLVLADRTQGNLETSVREKLAAAQEAYRADNRPDRPSDNE